MSTFDICLVQPQVFESESIEHPRLTFRTCVISESSGDTDLGVFVRYGNSCFWDLDNSTSIPITKGKIRLLSAGLSLAIGFSKVMFSGNDLIDWNLSFQTWRRPSMYSATSTLKTVYSRWIRSSAFPARSSVLSVLITVVTYDLEFLPSSLSK